MARTDRLHRQGPLRRLRQTAGTVQDEHRVSEGQGYPAESIEEGTIGTSTKHRRDERGHATSEVESFSLTQSFTVETMDVDLAKRLAKDPPSCCGAGSTSGPMPPAFFTKLEDLKLDLLEEAAANSNPCGALGQERGQPGCRRYLSVAGDFSDHPAELHPDIQLGKRTTLRRSRKSEGRRHDGVPHRVAPTHPLSQKKAPRNAGLKNLSWET